jgi:hypothetical protein
MSTATTYRRTSFGFELTVEQSDTGWRGSIRFASSPELFAKEYEDEEAAKFGICLAARRLADQPELTKTDVDPCNSWDCWHAVR